MSVLIKVVFVVYFFCNILCFVVGIIKIVLTIEVSHVFVTDVSIIIIIVLKIIISIVILLFCQFAQKVIIDFKNLKTFCVKIIKRNLLQALIFNKKTFVNHVKHILYRNCKKMF